VEADFAAEEQWLRSADAELASLRTRGDAAALALVESHRVAVEDVEAMEQNGRLAVEDAKEALSETLARIGALVKALEWQRTRNRVRRAWEERVSALDGGKARSTFHLQCLMSQPLLWAEPRLRLLLALLRIRSQPKCEVKGSRVRLQERARLRAVAKLETEEAQEEDVFLRGASLSVTPLALTPPRSPTSQGREVARETSPKAAGGAEGLAPLSPDLRFPMRVRFAESRAGMRPHEQRCYADSSSPNSSSSSA
jgi:hypothetical protein